MKKSGGHNGCSISSTGHIYPRSGLLVFSWSPLHEFFSYGSQNIKAINDHNITDSWIKHCFFPTHLENDHPGWKLRALWGLSFVPDAPARPRESETHVKQTTVIGRVQPVWIYIVITKIYGINIQEVYNCTILYMCKTV